ncbi:TetR/AcrR family transcriptional regulator [Crossiella equi]|uniref:TetR/AcrR family transcriptional regulator n=1 Tax=Crossiella equi TaxID=130796 RepID=UPI001177C919|nr:TetR/AcrR family transcriptional regulator [Crossiella equi]
MTVDALLTAAKDGMAEHGVDISVEDIAALAQVARRTAFRYFPTREELLSEALTAASAEYLRSLPRFQDGDWQPWFEELATLVHQRTVRNGRLYWELTTRRLPERLSQAYDHHRENLRAVVREAADTVWREAGGEGETPRLLRQTVAAHLNPLFTQAVLVGAEGSAELAADLTTKAVTATVRELLAG